MIINVLIWHKNFREEMMDMNLFVGILSDNNVDYTIDSALSMIKIPRLCGSNLNMIFTFRNGDDFIAGSGYDIIVNMPENHPLYKYFAYGYSERIDEEYHVNTIDIFNIATDVALRHRGFSGIICIKTQEVVKRIYDIAVTKPKYSELKIEKETYAMTNTTMKVKTVTIEKVIYSKPATIVLWSDGTKTVVKCRPGEVFDHEKGLAMCIVKKIGGNKGSYYNAFKDWIPETAKEDDEDLIAIPRDKYEDLLWMANQLANNDTLKKSQIQTGAKVLLNDMQAYEK